MPYDGVTIVGWTKHSFIDFPGTISTVLFFSGCNMQCPFCHNPGVVRGEPPPIDFDTVKTYIHKRQDVIEGVVLSGGEPTLHAGLPRLVLDLRALSMSVKLDTNGLLPGMIEACRPDYLALDIKTHPSNYQALGCALSDAAVRLSKSIAIVKAMGDNAEVRIPVVPGFIDEAVLKSLAVMLTDVSKVWLQPFQRDAVLLDPAMARVKPYTMEQMENFRILLEPYVGTCVIRGR
jgi:pyruvate formate lyase activating enzyme